MAAVNAPCSKEFLCADQPKQCADLRTDQILASIAPGENKGDRGVLTFDVVGITIGEESHDFPARVVDYAFDMKGTGVGAEEVAKTAAGGAAGAIIGAVAGDKEVVGAVAGAAVGAAVADRTQDRHIVVAAGNRIDLELTAKFDG